MQVLEDTSEISTAATTFEVLTHDTALPEMNMHGSYPEREGAKSRTKFHTILGTSVKNIVKFILRIKVSNAMGGG